MIGREGALAEIAGAVSAGRSVLVGGERGAGRTTVLAEVARQFTAAGGSVLVTRVLAGDGAVPLAALQRLLAPVRDRVPLLPPAARGTLGSLFGNGGPGHGPVPSAAALGEAVAALARLLTADGRWLWCVDDLHRCDPSSASAIASVPGIPVVATVPGAPSRPGWTVADTPEAPSPPGWSVADTPGAPSRPGWSVADTPGAPARPGWSVVVLPPLGRAAAGELLAALPGLAAHPAGHVVLAQAGGNPLALTELARTLPPPAAVPATATELPVPARLRDALAPGVAGLGPDALAGAVLAAVAAETPGRALAHALDALVAPAVWTQLAEAGVVRPGRLHRPAHPVVRAAVLERAGLAAQQDARRQLAARLAPDSPAYAWHLARSGRPLSDAHTTALERAGHRLAATGRLRPAAYALAMAAGHTPLPGPARERRNHAVHCARSAGEVAWAEQLAGADTASATTIVDLVGWAWLRGDDRARANLRAAFGAGGPPAWAAAIANEESTGTPPAASQATADHENTDAPPTPDRATTDNETTSAPPASARGTVDHDSAGRLPADNENTGRPPADDESTGGPPAWARAIADDDAGASYEVNLAGITPAQQATFAGVVALARHETAHARRHLRLAADLSPAGGYQRPIALTALAWAEFDSGELDRADDIAVAALRHPGAGDDIAAAVQVGAFAVRAAVALLQRRDHRAERLRDVLDSPVTAAPAHEQRLIRARGQADLVAGDFDLAYRRLRRLYEDGRPVHYRVSDLGLADLVAAAVALDRPDDVAPIVAAAEARFRVLGSVRLTAIGWRARALLAGPDPAAEEHYRLALADPGTAQWPLERAAASVDYARWLRRQRRPAAARALLEEARDAFAAARLPAWQQQAAGELAAATAPAHRDLSAQLTPQQHQVVRLAAQGLTNQQIATRLALSPRTVTTHLSRAFPVLGVTRRSQLRAVVDPGDG
ncbi:LuxR family transcriptional regulator [Actinoplanes sp. Pm04-4]|uniref:LuxR family transcriptional regulator n=1 Tax=Paractinoplanes pyxinae TaxID=2997416 RepID=A0ABT4ARA1_9ACTN|nr:LuxR family transcriptional regulator [Actinoplanes pyxinae]MCY1136756.1 LuxR family transcriptional regulator [Actinoplanes pyxinae]